MYSSQIINDVEVFRVENDVNGNPRYIIHFLDVSENYNEALFKARKIGGKKYRAKWFGGGIVFSSYNLNEDLKIIMEGK